MGCLRNALSRLATIVCLSGIAAIPLATLADETPGKPSLVDLGNGQFKMGSILIDKPARRFSVSGRVLRDQPPLEYLVVKKDGAKGYESLFELDTTASEFNLACILIGLDAKNAELPRHHFDPRPVKGDPVDLALEWSRDGSTINVRPETLLLIDGKAVEPGIWIYTGSAVLPDGRYLAEEAGTLIGFVHDQDSIIEHREGIGLGQFGKVNVDNSRMPPVGSPITIILRNAKEQ